MDRRQFLRASVASCLVLPTGGILLSGTFIEPVMAAGYGPTPKFSLKQATKAVNQLRAKHGRKPVQIQDQLQKAAEKQAILMAKRGQLKHSFGGSTSFRARIRAVGFQGRVAENIAAGSRSLEEVLVVWEKSSGHRRNMLNRKYHSFGLAVRSNAKSRYGHYWAMVLGV